MKPRVLLLGFFVFVDYFNILERKQGTKTIIIIFKNMQKIVKLETFNNLTMIKMKALKLGIKVRMMVSWNKYERN
jgi:hypothetical protein